MVVEDPPPVQYQSAPPQPLPRMGVLQAMRRSALLVVLPVILLVGGAVAYGMLRSPTYTSEARLNVGGLSLTQQTLAGYTTAVQQLAVAYSRAIDASPVVTPVARRLGLSPVDVASRVSATPVQGSPVIRVRATSKQRAEAQRLADAVAGSLVNYAFKLNSGSTQSKQLLVQFTAASREAEDAGARAQRLKPTDPRHKAAKVREAIARLKAQTSGALYQQSLAGQATTNLVQRLAPAAPATSDRSAVLQRFLAGALIAGLLIGVGLAVLRANRVTARRLGAR
jgi:capsular polysaccharide biosynthesis protein